MVAAIVPAPSFVSQHSHIVKSRIIRRYREPRNQNEMYASLGVKRKKISLAGLVFLGE